MKYLLLLSVLILGCVQPDGAKTDTQGMLDPNFLKERNKNCLDAISFLYPQVKTVQCDSEMFLNDIKTRNWAKCYTRVSRVATLSFVCKKLQDNSYWADEVDVKTIVLPEIKE